MKWTCLFVFCLFGGFCSIFLPLTASISRAPTSDQVNVLEVKQLIKPNWKKHAALQQKQTNIGQKLLVSGVNQIKCLPSLCSGIKTQVNVCFAPVLHLSSFTMSEMCLQLSILVPLELLIFTFPFKSKLDSGVSSLVLDFMTWLLEILIAFSAVCMPF